MEREPQQDPSPSMQKTEGGTMLLKLADQCNLLPDRPICKKIEPVG